MTHFGEEYTNPNAYFKVQANGRTMDIIKKFEADIANSKALNQAIAQDYQAISFDRAPDFNSLFILHHESDDPALKLTHTSDYNGRKSFSYAPNPETPEGRALEDRIQDTPDVFNGSAVFAKRLTGSANTPINPDGLRISANGEDRYGNRSDWISASFEKYGDVYIIEVPRVIRGIFNAASEKETKEHEMDGIKIAAGYKYEWFTPQDAEAIPYSDVMKLQERQKGDQTKPQQVKIKTSIIAFTPPSNRP